MKRSRSQGVDKQEVIEELHFALDNLRDTLTHEISMASPDRSTLRRSQMMTSIAPSALNLTQTQPSLELQHLEVTLRKQKSKGLKMKEQIISLENLLRDSEQQRSELRDKYFVLNDKVGSLLRTEELESEKNVKLQLKLKSLKSKARDLQISNKGLKEECERQQKLIEKFQRKFEPYKSQAKSLREELDVHHQDCIPKKSHNEILAAIEMKYIAERKELATRHDAEISQKLKELEEAKIRKLEIQLEETKKELQLHLEQSEYSKLNYVKQIQDLKQNLESTSAVADDRTRRAEKLEMEINAEREKVQCSFKLV